MSNYIEYTYQHTCKNGQKAYILKASPFRAVVKKTPEGKIKIPFLGEGYYFWEENVDAAIRWGEKHYKEGYNIVEYTDVKIDRDDLLDFLDRRDLKLFNELKEIYIKKRPKSANWAIGKWIEFFKKIKLTEHIYFPYNFIRAEQNLPNPKENEKLKVKMFFSEDSYIYTYTSPLLILCVIDKNNFVHTLKSVII